MCSARLSPLLSRERRSVLPSTAATSPYSLGAIAETRSTTLDSNCSGSTLANPSPEASWEGTPFGRQDKERNLRSLARPVAATVVRWFAPPITAHSAITMIPTKP